MAAQVVAVKPGKAESKYQDDSDRTTDEDDNVPFAYYLQKKVSVPAKQKKAAVVSPTAKDLKNGECYICRGHLADASADETRTCGEGGFVNDSHAGVGMCAPEDDWKDRCCSGEAHSRCILYWLRQDPNRSCPLCRKKLKAVRCACQKVHETPPLTDAERDALIRGDEDMEVEDEDSLHVGGIQAHMYVRSGLVFQRALARHNNAEDTEHTQQLLAGLWNDFGYFNSVVNQQVPLSDLFGVKFLMMPKPIVVVQEYDADGCTMVKCHATRFCHSSARKFHQSLDKKDFYFKLKLISHCLMPLLQTVLDTTIDIDTEDVDVPFIILLVLARAVTVELKIGSGDAGSLQANSSFSSSQIAFLLALVLDFTTKAPERLFCLTTKQTARARTYLGRLHYSISRGISTDGQARELCWLTCWLSSKDCAIPDGSSFALVFRAPTEADDEYGSLHSKTFCLEAAVPVNDATAFAAQSYQPYLTQGLIHFSTAAPLGLNCELEGQSGACACACACACVCVCLCVCVCVCVSS
jgi:hypothetical protein